MTKIDKQVKIKPLSVTRNIDISAISSLNGAQIAVNAGLFDANNLQTITRINPHYPRKAKIRRKEGYVQLQFHITKEGKVLRPVVVKAEPVGYFEEAALKAIKKWRFKPTDSEKDATITRINPHYPRKAKIRRKEGYVQLQFHITKEGKVLRPVVVKAEPVGYFEEAALKAIKKWRFKPTDSEKDATITFNFRLAR
eukprot:TRINITY_DN262605_c0_g1_i1.p1 TRINITY_DN262605_c0_g1~~TRINITY_DN262605_c0_g1_i1.p1  ORF type:complete len:229 (-),score=39.04 TRINITY_DN262605_c0_g1_i1:168-755(-)